MVQLAIDTKGRDQARIFIFGP